MLQCKKMFSVMAAGAVVALLAGMPAPAAAQQAAPAAAAPAATAAPAAAVQKPVLRARDLMTAQERQSYRQSMRAARDDVARRQQIRDEMRTTLRQRAAARGGVLWEPGMARPGMKEAGAAKREAKAEPMRPAVPPRAP